MWEGGWGLGTLSPEKCTYAQMFCTILGVRIKYPWAAPGTYDSLPILYFHKTFPQQENSRLGSTTEAGSLLFPQGDMVNYDEIKRFIRQEIIKLFDGNRQPLSDSGCCLPSPAASPSCPGLLFLSLTQPPHPTHRHMFK